MKAFFNEKTNNTPTHGESEQIPLEVRSIMDNIEAMKALKEKWEKRQQGLETLLHDIAQYRDQMHVKITVYTAKQKKEPTNSSIAKTLSFYTNEKDQAEALLLKTQDDLAVSEKQIQTIDEHSPFTTAFESRLNLDLK